MSINRRLYYSERKSNLFHYNTNSTLLTESVCEIPTDANDKIFVQ